MPGQWHKKSFGLSNQTGLYSQQAVITLLVHKKWALLYMVYKLSAAATHVALWDKALETHVALGMQIVYPTWMRELVNELNISPWVAQR